LGVTRVPRCGAVCRHHRGLYLSVWQGKQGPEPRSENGRQQGHPQAGRQPGRKKGGVQTLPDRPPMPCSGLLAKYQSLTDHAFCIIAVINR
jgi:hypothetical protein